MTFLRTLWCCHLVTGIVTSCYPSLSRKAEPLRSGERWLKRVRKLLYAVEKAHSYDLSVYALCSWLWKELLWFSILLFCNKLYKWSPCCVTRITFWPFRVSSHICECTWQFWPKKLKWKHDCEKCLWLHFAIAMWILRSSFSDVRKLGFMTNFSYPNKSFPASSLILTLGRRHRPTANRHLFWRTLPGHQATGEVLHERFLWWL